MCSIRFFRRTGALRRSLPGCDSTRARPEAGPEQFVFNAGRMPCCWLQRKTAGHARPSCCPLPWSAAGGVFVGLYLANAVAALQAPILTETWTVEPLPAFVYRTGRPLVRIPPDLADEGRDVDELVGLPPQLVGDHGRLRRNRRDDGHLDAAALHGLHQR